MSNQNSQGMNGTISNVTSGNITLGGNASLSNTSGAVWISPQTQTHTTLTNANHSYIWQQQPYTISSSGTFSIGADKDKYSMFKLPRKRIPEEVFVCGRLVTLGLLGSDVEAAFIGNSLVFAPKVLDAIRYGERITVVLKYSKASYHYNIDHSFGSINYEENSNMVKATLLSVIKRG